MYVTNLSGMFWYYSFIQMWGGALSQNFVFFLGMPPFIGCTSAELYLILVLPQFSAALAVIEVCGAYICKEQMKGRVASQAS